MQERLDTLRHGVRMRGADRRYMTIQENDVRREQSDAFSIGAAEIYGHIANDENDDLFEISLRCSDIRSISQDDCLNKAIWPKLFPHFCLMKFQQERHRFYMGLINTAEVLKNTSPCFMHCNVHPLLQTKQT